MISVRFLRSEEHTSELQSLTNLVCRLLLEKKTDRHAIATIYTPHAATAAVADAILIDAERPWLVGVTGCLLQCCCVFFFNNAAATEIRILPLHAPFRI